MVKGRLTKANFSVYRTPGKDAGDCYCLNCFVPWSLKHTTGIVQKSNSLWSFFLFYSVILWSQRFFSVPSVKTELTQWIDTENTGTALSGLFLLWSFCEVSKPSSPGLHPLTELGFKAAPLGSCRAT